MFHERDTDHRTRDRPIFLESKKKMTQKHNQPSTTATVKEVNHTSHWQQPSQSSSSNQPSYQHFNLHPEYQSNYHIHPSQYYQSYNYTPHTRQVHTPQLTITYPLEPLQITYLGASSQTTQQKTVEQPTSTSTSTAQSRILPTSHQFLSHRNYTHYHWRFQLEFREQEAKVRVRSLG
jgi:hypothetical protein